MSLTENLVNLFPLDAQVRGLRKRLESAERYFSGQSRHVEELETQRRELETRHRQIQAKIGNLEGETAVLDERLEKLRNELNAATTNKQYSAVLRAADMRPHSSERPGATSSVVKRILSNASCGLLSSGFDR